MNEYFNTEKPKDFLLVLALIEVIYSTELKSKFE